MPQWNLVIYFGPENGAKTNISELLMFFFSFSSDTISPQLIVIETGITKPLLL